MQEVNSNDTDTTEHITEEPSGDVEPEAQVLRLKFPQKD